MTATPAPKSRRWPLPSIALAMLGPPLAVATIFWLVAGGLPQLHIDWQGRLGESEMALRERLGVGSGPLALILDALVSGLAGLLVPLLAAAQLLLALLLLLAFVALARGDEAGFWHLRIWAWWTLAVDALFAGLAAEIGPGPWVRMAYAVLVLLVVRTPTPPPPIDLDAAYGDRPEPAQTG